MTEILIAVAVLAGCGLIFGIILAVASKFFAVQTDERIEKITECLPGANCGGCGFAGCGAFAQAVVNGEAKVNGCSAGGAKTAQAVAQIMGCDAGDTVEKRACVMCSGSDECAEKKYIYDGYESCAAVMRLGGGDKLCSFACLGKGDCVSACSFKAISVIGGVAVVDAEKCGGCGSCAKACPRHVIHIIPKTATTWVSCSSKEKGVQVKKACTIGCIGCKICEKKCEAGAIAVTDNLAKIDWEKCTGCGKCAEACPRKIIINSNGKAEIIEKID
ncbi:MAG: Fe-S cluster domain-containing protein [Ruminococcaceae bacterium]|nr:Fe-S cluster domain-containing protein [Oscillospiraceae bacterium]